MLIWRLFSYLLVESTVPEINFTAIPKTTRPGRESCQIAGGTCRSIIIGFDQRPIWQ